MIMYMNDSYFISTLFSFTRLKSSLQASKLLFYKSRYNFIELPV